MSNKPRTFTFVHAADLHLGSPFKGITAHNPDIADALRSATFDAYNALIDLCIEQHAAFLLISGDVYDAEERSLKAQLRFRDGMERLAAKDISVFVAHGNHDPYSSRSSSIEWPDNVHIFDSHKPESKTVHLNGEFVARVSGISHGKRNETQNLAKRFEPLASGLPLNPGLLQIGVLHCNVGANTGHEPYAPCELSDLIRTRFDYWALGHVHAKRFLAKDPLVVYAGNIQGRHFHETGEKGCFVVDVEDGTIRGIQFYPLDAIRWVEASVGIDGLTTIDQLDRRITETLQTLVSEAGQRAIICRISITGRGSIYGDLRRNGSLPDLLERMRESFAGDDPFVWVQDIHLDCRPEIDMETRKEAGDFLAQVLRISDEITGSSEKMGELTKTALADLLRNRQFEKAIGGFSEQEIRQMFEEAVLLCADKLEVEE